MKKIYFGEIIMWIILILAVIGLIGIITLTVIEWTTQEEVETYTIGMEIIEKDYSVYYVKNSGTRTKYILNLRGSGHAIVMNVGEQTYAKYAVGELLEVEVTELESALSTDIEYKIVGLQSVSPFFRCRSRQPQLQHAKALKKNKSKILKNNY